MANPSDQDSGIRGKLLSEAENLGVDQTNFVKAALTWQYNWIGLAGAAAFAIVSGSGLPLLMAAGLELIYISVVPQSSRFRRLVRSWQFAEEKRKHDVRQRQLLLELPPPVQQRYANVQNTCRQIRANYDRFSSTSQIFLGQTEQKFQGLLYGYLRLLQTSHQQQMYVQTSDATSILNETKQLKNALDRDSPKVREINQKRIEILQKRLDKFEKIRENWHVVEAQCSAIEDVLGLVRDQSMTMRDPQELTDRLDTLMQDVEQTENNVREVESLLESATPDLPQALLFPAQDSQPAARNRQRN
jgi:low affinity Fe/Cu permease